MSPIPVDRWHTELFVFTIKKYLMRRDLSILTENHDSLRSQRQLSLHCLVSRTDNGNIVPNNKFSKVFFDEDYFLVEWNKKCFLLYFIYFCAGEEIQLENVVDRKESSLDILNVNSDINMKLDDSEGLAFTWS